jgi:hypothetical protein
MTITITPSGKYVEADGLYWCRDAQNSFGHCICSGYRYPCGKCAIYQCGFKEPNYPVPALPMQVSWCDDGALMLHTEGDIITTFQNRASNAVQS